MKKLKFCLEYSGILVVDLFFICLPENLALKLGEWIGLFFCWVIPKRRSLVMENLKQAFPEKSLREIKRISGRVWRNLGRVGVEFIRVPKITPSNYQDFFSYEGQDHIDQARSLGKGIVMAGFHLSNWEWSGLAAQFDLKNVVAIARPMKNPYVENWIQRKRQGAGMDIILHRQAVRASLKAIKQKKSVAILMDQNLYQGGVFVDFFGRPAATTTLPALLHSRTGAPVLIAYGIRKGKKIQLNYGKPIDFPEVEDPSERLQVFTQIITKEIEKVIRSNPEYWFWIHNRWKRKPLETY
ncbi:hypothetical protein BVX98_02730 [bacterium F11]|nr:hypothetical protein BVX98_02730 [bacterium F11]